jgi:hypothetical protein
VEQPANNHLRAGIDASDSTHVFATAHAHSTILLVEFLSEPLKDNALLIKFARLI